MVEALVGKIEGLLTRIGLFDKDLLLASFLPSLLFFSTTILTLAGVIGFEACKAWFHGQTATAQIELLALTGVAVFVFAFIVHGLQTFFLRLWSGNINLLFLSPFLRLGEALQSERYHKLLKQADQPRKWGELSERFDETIDRIYEGQPKKWGDPSTWFAKIYKPEVQKLPIPADTLSDLKNRMASLREDMNIDEVRDHLHNLILAHETYRAESFLDVQKFVRDSIEDWKTKEQINISTSLARLDRQFGVPQTIRATGLGNIIESYNVYPFKRYGIEGEIFWPRLQQILKPEFLITIRESKTLLHFWFMSATLSFLFGILALFGGPWLWLNYAFWSVLSLGAFAAGYLFYRVAMYSADQFGDLIRASFDLFRLDLLFALSIESPPSLSKEREKWTKIGQLLVFGNTKEDMEIRQRQT